MSNEPEKQLETGENPVNSLENPQIQNTNSQILSETPQTPPELTPDAPQTSPESPEDHFESEAPSDGSLPSEPQVELQNAPETHSANTKPCKPYDKKWHILLVVVLIAKCKTMGNFCNIV